MSTVPGVSCRDGTFHTEYNRPATFKVSVQLKFCILHMNCQLECSNMLYVCHLICYYYYLLLWGFFCSLTRATSRHGKFVNMPEKLSAWIYIFCVKFFWYILLVNMLRSAVWCSFLPSLVTQQHIQDIRSNLFFDCNLWASVKPAGVFNSNLPQSMSQAITCLVLGFEGIGPGVSWKDIELDIFFLGFIC